MKRRTNLQPGDDLYFVLDVDPPDPKRHTWQVMRRRVRQVRLDGFTFERSIGFGQIQKYHTLDVRFHRSPEAAVRAFVVAKREEIEGARRAIAEAERALAWAEAHPGGRPSPALDPRGRPRES